MNIELVQLLERSEMVEYFGQFLLFFNNNNKELFITPTEGLGQRQQVSRY